MVNQAISPHLRRVECRSAPVPELHICWECLEHKLCIPVRLLRGDVVKQLKWKCLDCIGFVPVFADAKDEQTRARRKLPAGHKFFYDCERENTARSIEWAMTRKGIVSLFATLTFKSYIHPVKARKMLKRWLARVNMSCIDKGGGRLTWMCASEWQQRKVLHFHLLLFAEGLERVSRKSIEARWQNSGGGFARVYDAVLQAAPYLAKYASKGADGDIERGGFWQGYDVPASVCCKCSAPGDSP